MTPILSKSAGVTLLSAARLTLQTYIKTLRLPELELSSSAITQPSGAFVTLWLRGEVRGCVGSIHSEEPLYRTVIALTAAASEDSRFAPIGAEELHQVRIEITVVSPLVPFTSLADVEPGGTGVALDGDPPFVILPDVARENGWGPEELLGNLCEMAGLPERAWRSGAPILCFTTHTVSEEER